MKRIVGWAILMYVTGIVLARYIEIESLIRFAVVIIITFVIRAGMGRIQDMVMPVVLATFLLAGIFLFHISDDIGLRPIAPFIGQSITYSGKVVQSPVIKENKIEYVIEISEIKANEYITSLKSKIKLTCITTEKTAIYQYGDVLQVKGRLQIPSNAMNTGGFDYNNYLKAKGIYAIGFAAPQQIEKLHQKNDKKSIIDFLFLFRQKVIHISNTLLPTQEAAILKGMLMGDHADFTEEMNEDFSRSGLSHLVAVSGMHVAILLMGLTYLLNLLRINRKIVNIIGMIAVIFYILIVGGTPSVTRAGIMAIIFLLASILDRQSDALTSLFIAALMMLIYNPMFLFSVGFQLSFCATSALLIFYQPVYMKLSFLQDEFIHKKIYEVLIASIVVQIGTIPLTAYYFNGLSIVSLGANLVVIPLVSIALISGIVLVLMGFIHIILGQAVAGFTYVFLKLIGSTAHLFARLPFALVKVPSPNIIFCITYLLILFIVYNLLKGEKDKTKVKWSCYLFAVVIVCAIVLQFSQLNNIEVTFINVGQGDSALIRCNGGKTILIDGGENTVVPYLLKQGVGKIDVAIVSHYHDDHTQGILSVLDEMPVETLALPFREQGNELHDLFIQIAQDKQIPVYYLTKGDELEINKKTYMEVIAPDLFQTASERYGENDQSLVIRFHYGDSVYLFTGDIEKSTEEYISSKNIDLKADVLKVAHHGSDTSTTTAFLSTVAPEYAVISVGRNQFGHPSKEVIERLESAKVKVFRTDTNGTITFITDKKKIRKVKVLREGE